MARNPTPSRPPFWDRRRLGWVNSLGFALSCIYGGWLLLMVFRTFMPGADPVEFTIPMVFVGVVLITLLANLVFCGLVLSHAARGAHFDEEKPRMHVLLWSVSGLAFFLVTAVVLMKFGGRADSERRTLGLDDLLAWMLPRIAGLRPDDLRQLRRPRNDSRRRRRVGRRVPGRRGLSLTTA